MEKMSNIQNQPIETLKEYFNNDNEIFNSDG